MLVFNLQDPIFLLKIKLKIKAYDLLLSWTPNYATIICTLGASNDTHFMQIYNVIDQIMVHKIVISYSDKIFGQINCPKSKSQRQSF